MSVELHRELGEHDAKIENLEKEVHLLRQDVARIFEKLDDINLTLSSAKGGWKTLLLIGGAISGLVAFFNTIFHWVTSK